MLRRWYAQGNSSLPGAGRAWSTPSGRRSMCGRWVGSHCFNRYLPHLVTCSPLIPLFGSEAEPVGICPERKDARRRRKFRPRRGGDPFFGRGEESPALPADDSGRGTAAGRDTLFHREEPGGIDPFHPGPESGRKCGTHCFASTVPRPKSQGARGNRAGGGTGHILLLGSGSTRTVTRRGTERKELLPPNPKRTGEGRNGTGRGTG